jgi:hypothetical protein
MLDAANAGAIGADTRQPVSACDLDAQVLEEEGIVIGCRHLFYQAWLHTLRVEFEAEAELFGLSHAVTSQRLLVSRR